MAEMTRAEVTTSEGDQSVRIPAAYRFHDGEVFIRQDALSGDVILSQKGLGRQGKRSMAEILADFDKIEIPEDFLSPAERADAQAMQERSEL